MANIKSQKKRVKTNEKRRLRNVANRSRMRTFIKKAEEALSSKDAEKVTEIMPQVLSEIDRAAGHGAIHAKSASRKKSSLQRQAAEIQ